MGGEIMMNQRRRAQLLALEGAFFLIGSIGCAADPPATPAGPGAIPTPQTESTESTSEALLLISGSATATGAFHNCALIDGGAVKCWGMNSAGQLGLGDTNWRGDGPNEMGSTLGYVPLGRPAIAVSAGYMHTCALLDNNQVKCWGNNGDGELGLGDTNSRGD